MQPSDRKKVKGLPKLPVPVCINSAEAEMYYRKNPENSDTRKKCCKYPEMFCYRVMGPKVADGMANSVDPDERSSLIWVYTVCPDVSVRKVRIIMIVYIVKKKANKNPRNSPIFERDAL